jgi:hypothetical protein
MTLLLERRDTPAQTKKMEAASSSKMFETIHHMTRFEYD